MSLPWPCTPPSPTWKGGTYRECCQRVSSFNFCTSQRTSHGQCTPLKQWSLLPQKVEVIVQVVLQMRYWEPPNWMHHHLVQKLYWPQPQSDAEWCSLPNNHWRELPPLKVTYTRWCRRKAVIFIRESSYLSHALLTLQPPGRWSHSIWCWASRIWDIFFLQDTPSNTRPLMTLPPLSFALVEGLLVH